MVLNESNLRLTRGKNLNECSFIDRCETLAFYIMEVQLQQPLYFHCDDS